MRTLGIAARLLSGIAFWVFAAGPGGAVDLPGGTVERLVLTTPENTVDTVVGEVIVREAYRRLGIDVVIKKYPAERAVRLANQGEVDGEVQRIGGLAEKYPNLIEVRPAINFVDATVFTKATKFPVQGWESLSPYRIGLIRGIKFAEQNTAGMSVALVGGYEVLFRLLDRGRVDVALSPRVNGWYYIKRTGMDGIRSLEPSVAVFDLYHYLNRKHADLVPYFSAMVSRMRASGELPRIRARVVSVMMERAERNLGPCDDDYACFDPPRSGN
jgi:polar amino acid transport system substrate-binding protein